MFKGLANLGSLLRGAQQISGRMHELNERMKGVRATGTAGGGMVEIELNGLMEVLRCKIDPQLITQGDRELIEDLVVGAMNQAVTKAKQAHADLARELTGGLELPGLNEAIAKFTGIQEEAAATEEPGSKEGEGEKA